MKKFIGKSAAIAAAALLFAQTVPMVKVDAAGSNTLYIHSYSMSADDYNTASQNNSATGSLSDTVPVGANEVSGRTYKIYKATSDGNGGYTIAGTEEGSIVTGDGNNGTTLGVGFLAGLEDGVYWVNPIDSSTNAAFDNADGFYVGLPAASREVHVFPKHTVNTGDSHTVVFTKKDAVDSNVTLDGVSYKVYFKNSLDKWEAAQENGADKLFATDQNGEIEIDKLPIGTYYFVEQNPKTGYLLDQTPIAVTIDGTGNAKVFKEATNDKKLTVSKEIAGDAAGDVFNWTITADVPTKTENLVSYVITDSYTNLDTSQITVSIDNMEAGTDKDYILSDTSSSPFTISLTKTGIGKLTSGTPLVVKVSSKLENGKTSATNTASISYQYAFNPDYENPNPVTPNIPGIKDPDSYNQPDGEVYPEVITYTPNASASVTAGSIIISNIEMGDTNKAELGGSSYKIFSESNFEMALNDNADDAATNPKLAEIANLAPGTYKIQQTKVTNGYKVNDTPKTVFITADGKVYVDSDSNGSITKDTDGNITDDEITSTNKLVFENQKTNFNFNLPFTGTTATRVFTIAGICVMLAAGTLIFVVLRKKDDDGEETKG